MSALSKFGNIAIESLRAISKIDPVTQLQVKTSGSLTFLGSEYGGWTIPDHILDSTSICYCVGCGEDISFDLSIIKTHGCYVYGFDPTPRAIDYVNKHASHEELYHFQPVGIWDKNTNLKFFSPADQQHVSYSLVNLQGTDQFIEVPVRSLDDLMRESGHKHLDLLKLDIEGAEYRVIDSIIDNGISNTVLCVEFDEIHNPMDSESRIRIRKSASRLISAGYQLVHAQSADYTFLKANN